MIGNTVSKTGYRKLRQWIGYAYCCSYHLFYHEDHLFYQKGLSSNDKSVSWSYALLLSTWLGILQILWRVQRWWCITQHFTVKKTPVDQCFETPKNDLTDICACSANPRRGCILGCNFFWQMEILFMRKDLKNKQRLIGKLFDGVN